MPALRRFDPGKPRDLEKFWFGQKTFPENGIAQETCRDLGHTGWGLSATSHVAETSRIQGTDLYTGEVGTRLRDGLEFNLKYESSGSISWLCNGKPYKAGLGLGR